jgi:RNA recognition motif-containing protein
LTNIFVGNLSYQTTEDELHQQFSAFGTVERVSIIRDRESGQSRGFGFVEMPNSEEAERAIQNMNGRQISGRALNVNEARPRDTRSGGGGGGGYGGGGGGGRGGNRGGGGGYGGGGGNRREPRW